MRSSARLVTRLATLASFLLAAAPALADEPATPPPTADTAPAPPVPPAAAPEPATEPVAAPPPPSPTALPGADRPAEAGGSTDDVRRAEGIRLALDLGFMRAFDGATDRLNYGTPTLLPLGADFSFRTSGSFLVGAHGFVALASRDDCISADSCRARAYGFGAHVEGTVTHGRSWALWLRYGIGYEILYHGGLPLDPAGHTVRDAIDLVDFRVGADFTVHRRDEAKTARIGPFMGLVAGALVNQSGVTHVGGSIGQTSNLERGSGSAHVWFAMGVRATLDP